MARARSRAWQSGTEPSRDPRESRSTTEAEWREREQPGRARLTTGASTGIGLELAKLTAADGYDLLVVADTPFLDTSAGLLGAGTVQTIETDLATIEGVDRLLETARGREGDLLCADAGHGLGHAFLDQSVSDWRHARRWWERPPRQIGRRPSEISSWR